MATLRDEILGSIHPDYKANQAVWERNEARFLAGEDARSVVVQPWEDSGR